MKTTKRIWYDIISTDENKLLEQWAEHAKNGWLLESVCIGYFYGKYRKCAAEEVIFSRDIFEGSPEEYQEYLEFYDQAGWEKVCSLGKLRKRKSIYPSFIVTIFKAPMGTLPLHVDKESQNTHLNKQLKTLKMGSRLLIGFSTLGLIIELLDNRFSFMATPPGMMASYISILLILGLTFSLQAWAMKQKQEGKADGILQLKWFNILSTLLPLAIMGLVQYFTLWR
ncbi:MAG: DUF2812 domain-containing protein [Turicibacter sp.]|nr:DUF2812 domain-containing protein [Turicibacter sp.]